MFAVRVECDKNEPIVEPCQEDNELEVKSPEDIADAGAGIVRDRVYPVVEFSTGNPVVETHHGRLHLYREVVRDEKGVPLPQPPQTTCESDLLCVIGIPARMTPSEFLEFTACFHEHVQQMRVLLDEKTNQHMVTIQFESVEKANQFYIDFNGKPFNAMEPERCYVVPVQNIEFDNPEKESCIDPKQWQEIPSCPVCLERMDMSVSGILVIMCNHMFHCQCLFKWPDSSCPVCRYCHEPEQGLSTCESCGSSEDLWICLICGHIGCGRYCGEHAISHYQQTMHAYAMDMQSQRVWDYAGDGYVHRLIHNRTDGKIVEFPDVHGIPSDRRPLAPSIHDVDSDVLNAKMEAISLQYSNLLSSQLDTQRVYFENRIAMIESEHCGQIQCAQQQFGEELKVKEDRIAKLEKELKQREKKEAEQQECLKKQNSELEFLQAINTQLATNQQQNRERIAELEDQVRDLMFFIETQKRLEDNPEHEEIKEGTLVIENSERKSKQKSGKGRRRR